MARQGFGTWRSVVYGCVALVLNSVALGAQPTLRWLAADGSHRFELELCGLPTPGSADVASNDPAEWVSVKVVEGEQSPEDLPSLWGAWKVVGECWVFSPRHAPAAGMTLVARFDGKTFDRLRGKPTEGGATPSVELRHQLASSVARVKVSAVHPSGDEIPENLLRIYVEFDGAMSLRDVAQYVHLENASGQVLAGSFVEIPEGLWDPGRRRLTLFLHPGRVKTGIAVGDALGKPFQVGQEITLVIDSAARDADGATLAAPFRKVWRVVEAERRAIDPAAFCLAPPQEPDDAVRLDGGRPLDRALLASQVAVVELPREDPGDDPRASGATVAGRLEIAPGDQVLRFFPATAWKPGVTYAWVFGEALEDPAGNRLGSPFERQLEHAAVPVSRHRAFRLAEPTNTPCGSKGGPQDTTAINEP